MRGGEVSNIPTHPIQTVVLQRTACYLVVLSARDLSRHFFLSDKNTMSCHVFTFTTIERGWGILHPNHPSIKRWCCQRTACSAVSEGLVALIEWALIVPYTLQQLAWDPVRCLQSSDAISLGASAFRSLNMRRCLQSLAAWLRHRRLQSLGTSAFSG